MRCRTRDVVCSVNGRRQLRRFKAPPCIHLPNSLSPTLPPLMLRSLSRVCALSLASAAARPRLNHAASLRAPFASQPPQQPRSRAPPPPQQQQQRGPGQIVPPPGAAAPPPLPSIIEVTPESAEAIFTSSRSAKAPNITNTNLKRHPPTAHTPEQHHPHNIRFLRILVRALQDTHAGAPAPPPPPASAVPVLPHARDTACSCWKSTCKR